MTLRQFRIKSQFIGGESDLKDERLVYESEKERIYDLIFTELKAEVSFLKDGTMAFTTTKTTDEVKTFLQNNGLTAIANDGVKVQLDTDGTNKADEVIDSV